MKEELVLDPSPKSLKLLRNSSEFMPFIVFLAAPGMEEMQSVYNNLRVSNAMSSERKSKYLWKKFIHSKFLQTCSDPGINVIFIRWRRCDEEFGGKCATSKSIFKLFRPCCRQWKPWTNISTSYGCLASSLGNGSMGAVDMGLLIILYCTAESV